MAVAAAWLAHLRTAAEAAAWALGRVLAAAYYLVVVPLRYPLWYAYRLAAFLLSPVRVLAVGVAAGAEFVVWLAAELQVGSFVVRGMQAKLRLHQNLALCVRAPSYPYPV